MTDAVLYTVAEPHIALVTLNRPEARNAVNGAVAAGLEAALLRSEADPGVRVVILTGAGPHAFCAGADLKEVAAGRVATLATERGGFGGLVRAPRSKCWIAAAQGHALAGGLELLLACDLAVGAESATFGLPEVKRSLVAAAGGVFRLPRALPKAIALRMIATGEPIDAATAHRHGLLNEVAPAASVLETALCIARTIAGNAPMAVRESLAIARAAATLPEEEAWQRSNAASAFIRTTQDFQEGPRAFVEKRAPNWTGR